MLTFVEWVVAEDVPARSHEPPSIPVVVMTVVGRQAGQSVIAGQLWEGKRTRERRLRTPKSHAERQAGLGRPARPTSAVAVGINST